MSKKAQAQDKIAGAPARPAAALTNLAQQKCSCGAPAGMAGVCDSCSKERLSGKRSASATGNSASHADHNFSRMSVQADESRQASTPRQSSRSITVVEHHREQFSALIRRVPKSQSTARSLFGPRKKRSPAFGLPQNDAKKGSAPSAPIDFATLFAQSKPASAGPSRELQEGETIRLPDVSIPGMAELRQTDNSPIASTLTYNPSIAQSGPPPSPFGETKPYTHTVTNISVMLKDGAYRVTANVDNPITFQVNGGGNVDIDSETDPDITNSNYPTVVSDLTPDMTDQGGAPPRTHFWAEDLTIRHERFHADENAVYGRAGVVAAQAWLNSQTAATVADVRDLVNAVPARVAATVDASMAFPAREERAYRDGAPLYLERANAIKAKGEGGEYAEGGGPAPKKGMSRGAKVGIGILAGAIAGAGIGAIGGGVGALIGAGIGAVVGLIAGLVA